MRKLYWKRAVKIVSLLLAVVLAVFLLQQFVFREFWQYGQGSMRVKGFYREPKNTLDVVLIGDSTVYAGYSPAYAYETQGITSYNYAIGANVCTTWCPITEEILRRQDPQLIVVEMGGIAYTSLQQKHEESSTVHALVDNMPLSANKIRTIRDVVVGVYGDNAAEYYIPFVRYHNEWSGFGELWERVREMCAWRGVLRGTVARAVSEPVQPDTMDVRRDDSTEELAPESEAILRDYLEFCRENGVNVLFVSVPCRIRENDESRLTFLRENRAGQIVEEYGFRYINFHRQTEEIGLDLERDFYNDAHLNYRGQIKFTEFFARFLAEEYGVSSHGLTEAQRESWEESGAYIGLFYRYAEALSERGEDVLLTERIEVMDALDALRDGG